MPKFVCATPFVIHPEDDLLEKQPGLRHSSARLANNYPDKRRVSEDELKTVGTALWNALPADTSARFEEAIKKAGPNILPVIVESDIPSVQSLPWETLFHPKHGFIARDSSFALSRRASSPVEEEMPPRPAPLKVLLFTSLPDDLNPETEQLNVEKEQERVQQALLPYIVQGKAQLEIPDDGRLETLEDLLKRFEPHVLYLSGHGKFVEQPGSEHEPFGVFIFEGDDGKSRPVTEDELSRTLVGSGVQIVVLSACESGKGSSSDLNNGLARRLAAMGIPHVAGMRESVLDEAGIQFADAFCKALADEERVDVAMQSARAAMDDSASGATRRETISIALGGQAGGQWCLPMLISPEPARPLANWSLITPAPTKIGKQSLPPRFIGRRKELRRYKHRLLTGKTQHLLITGAGGHGKTTLARKLAHDLSQRGYTVFEWRADSPWRDFQANLADALKGESARNYGIDEIRFQDKPEKLAASLFELLALQYENRLVFLFDNLESIQDEKTYNLTDPQASAWLKAACSDKMNFIVLATSRWVLPEWNGEHLPLESMNKGDFLRLTQTLYERGQLNPLMLERERLNQAYETLGHNPRGLEWLAAATLTMDSQEEQAFAEKLAQTRADLRQNMALEETLRRLSPDAYALLRRLPVYAAPVPAEGIIKLGLDLLDPAAALENLLAFSLLEITENTDYETLEYQVEPSLHDYLVDKNLLDADSRAKNAAADYLLWLMEHERKTYAHLALTIEALRHAERHNEADRLTLDTLVERYTLDGRYAELLTRWLPQVLNSDDKKVQAEALGQTGKLHLHLGKFKEAMPYFRQSLDICRQIGDKAGEGTTLNNISQIFKAQGDYETALIYLKQSLDIMRQIGDKAGEGATLNNISQIYDAQGDYETALTYLKQSLDIRRKIGDKAGEGTTLNNISQIYDAQGDYETALTYLKQSLDIMRQIGDKAGEGTTLNNISQIYDAQGDYESALTYLKQSLDIMRQIGDKAGEGTTLNNISQIYDAQGDYETALTYLKQSLDIMRQIGDKAGLCATLFNMGHIHAQNNQMQEAVSAWVTAYVLAKQMNLAQVLDALKKLAPQLGLPEGLEGWEMLAQRMQAGEDEKGVGSSEEEQIAQFVSMVVKAVREKSEDAPKLFEAVSKMAVDSNAPPHYQELGSVLKKFMSGIKNPDLSKLPKEIAEIVQKAIGSSSS